MSPCLFFQYFTDGTTNKLVGCYLEDSPEDVVLVRVYGNKTELIVDRDNELKSFQVNAKTRILRDLDAEEQFPERFPCSPLCRFSMLTAVLLISTAPFTTESAMSSFTGKLWGRRMCGILQSSGQVEMSRSFTCWLSLFSLGWTFHAAYRRIIFLNKNT